jgi:hypothetical protein
MELTKKKLEQLIMEEYVRSVGDEYRKINRPEYTEKLASLYQNPDTREQAEIYADEFDDKPEIAFDSNEMETKPYVSDNDRIRTFRKWMVSKGYGPQIRRILQGPIWDGYAQRVFKEFLDETRNYRAYNAVLAAYRVNYIPFLDEETGAPLPLGSPRPFRGTNTYHYPRP